MLCTQSTTKDYIRAEHKLHSISKLFISQVIIPRVMLFEPIYIPRALNMGTCLRQGDQCHSVGLRRNHVLATANTGNIGRELDKMQVNGPEGISFSTTATKRKKKKDPISSPFLHCCFPLSSASVYNLFKLLGCRFSLCL